MFWIGCHLSAAKGYMAMGKEAERLGANVFQFFTRNPRGGSVKALDRQDVEEWNTFAAQKGFGPLLAHAPYTMNACSADPRLREFAHRMMEEDLERLELLQHVMYNFHPGSHVKQGAAAGIQMIVAQLNAVLQKKGRTPILLETMAGKGSEVGRSFYEIREILEGVGGHPRMGVCLDTCHVYDGGYDIVENLDGVLDEFDRIIGLERLCAIHLNDSKNPLGSHKDRHEKIGEGSLGIAAIEKIINHPRLMRLPFYLETPNDAAGYAAEIAWLKTLRK